MSNSFEPQSGWALATIEGADGDVACLETGGGLYDLSAALEAVGGEPVSGTAAVFERWQHFKPLLDKAAGAVDASMAVPAGRRKAPLPLPGKVLCAGANYYRHLEEMGVTGATKENQRLFFFFKPPRNAVVGEGDSVHMPLDTECFDWEVELAAVIGKRARAVPVETALDHVAGYTVAVDFCARDLNRAPETFYKLDWVAGKAQETCCPLGPRFVPADAISDPQALAMRLSVNDTVKQDDTSGDMIFSIAEQISILSRIMALDPGDVLLTGTPAGVGAARPEFLAVGDRVDAAIEGIGTLSVTIQPPKLD